MLNMIDRAYERFLQSPLCPIASVGMYVAGIVMIIWKLG